MLVIERKVSEGIWIGDAFVKILPGTTSSRIRLGIDAPREVLILREELKDRENPATVQGPWDHTQRAA